MRQIILKTDSSHVTTVLLFIALINNRLLINQKYLE